MTEPHVLTIDLGTSGPKAAVVSRTGRIAGSAQARLALRFTDDGGVEQDPEEVWSTCLDSATRALAASGIDAGDVVAVVPSSQYSSIVPVDAGGRPLADMVLWMDGRGAAKKLARLPGGPPRDSPAALLHWVRVHGLAPLGGGMSLTHMRWFRFARPEVYDRTAAFLEPMDYLALRLTGRATANQSTAYMMLLTDNRTLGATDWDEGLLARSHIDRDRLPELVAAGSEVGPLLPGVAEALGLAPSTPVLSGINDTQAGAVAAGAFQGAGAGLAVGTTAVIAAHVARKKTDPRTTLFTVPSPLGDTYLVTAENGVAGVDVDHFLDQIVYPDDALVAGPRPDDAYAALEAAAAAASPGAGRVLFLPWLKGSLAPTVDGKVRGGFLNVGLGTTRQDLARALFEGIALNARRLKGPVESFSGRDIAAFTFYGGGARSDLWAQVMADVLRVPVRQLDEPSHANSLGAGLFGLVHLGLVDVDDVAGIPRVRGVYEPDPDLEELYGERAEAFAEAFRRTRPLFHRLNRRPGTPPTWRQRLGR